MSSHAQVVNLLEDLQNHLNLTYLFIAHDLSLVRHISDWAPVMYLGKVIKLAMRKEPQGKLLKHAIQALMSDVPIPDLVLKARRQRVILSGDPPSPANPALGCECSTRCPLAIDIFRRQVPDKPEVRQQHWVHCHRV